MEESKYRHRGLALADPVYYKELRQRAEYNRNHPTDAERVLWTHLSQRTWPNAKFRRQHIIDQYIVDFACLSYKLVIEIDGGYHFTPDQIEEDRIRSMRITSLGFRIIRFTNQQIFTELDNVLLHIQKALIPDG